jgi:hypothetical protein
VAVVVKTWAILIVVALGMGVVVAAVFLLGVWTLMADFKTLRHK